MTYYVEADGVKSPTFTMTVVELPAVTALEMEYVYPAYTGLAPQKVEVGGDVAAIAGTEVRVKITSSMADAGRTAAAGSGGDVAASRCSRTATLTGSFKISKDGYYQRRARRPARREGGGLAEIHDRRDRRSRADGVVRQAEARHVRESGRGSVRAGARRRTTSACGSSISSTR